ncbi:MAG TPA: hypothetical protein VEP90_07525, partial [Methylomirabilota bacterium]|nr:hypothetical protein [Methylomirabilota bacterium]
MKPTKKRLFSIMIMAFLLMSIISMNADRASVAFAATQTIVFPIDEKTQPWGISSGYQSVSTGGDHTGYTLYGIDLVRWDNASKTVNTTVLSPVDGTIQYGGVTNDGTGRCVFILVSGSSNLKVSLCHINYDSGISTDGTNVISGKSVTQGFTKLGTIAQGKTNPGFDNTHLHINV